jgi:hypothetical protein
MVDVVSRRALRGPETHDAWVTAFAAITSPPFDLGRAACPNCGHFDLRFQFLVDEASRIGLCALWSPHCGHGHTLSRVRAPEGAPILALDAPDAQVQRAIPDFIDVAAASRPTSSADRVATLLAAGHTLRQVADELHLAPTTVRTLAAQLREGGRAP